MTDVEERPHEEPTFHRALAAFDETSPALLDTRELQRRVDRKYLLPSALLDGLLTRLHAGYQIVRSGDTRVAHYDTLYFDTVERRMYDDHRRGRDPRYKVRLRHHLDRRLSFLEIKCKRGRHTSKMRMNRPYGDTRLDGDAWRFIESHCPISPALLLPCVSVDYRRVTLVGGTTDERVTLDWAICFRDRSRHAAFPGLVIVEIKQRRCSNTSPAIHAIRALHLREARVSKYCLATATLAPVRANVFKPMLTAMEHRA